MSTTTAPPAAPASITIDRNARKTLLAALALRLESHFEGIHTTLRDRDRMLLSQGQEFFGYLSPILDGLEFWDEGGGEVPAATYTIPAGDWLRELMEDYILQTRNGHDSDEQELSDVADKGVAAFEEGSYLHDPDATRHPNVLRREWITDMRQKLEDDRDELVGAQSILFAMLEATR